MAKPRTAVYAALRFDIITALAEHPDLSQMARFVFLAVSAEAHGLEYTNISIEALAKRWKLSASSISRAYKELEDHGFVIQDDHFGNRTKEKRLAKWINSDLTFGGYDASGSEVVEQPDYLTYRLPGQPDKALGQGKVASYLSGMVSGHTDTQPSHTDQPLRHTDSQSSHTDRVYGLTDRVYSHTDMVDGQCDMVDGPTDRVYSQRDRLSCPTDQLIIKEQTIIEKKREDSSLVDSLSTPINKEVTVEEFTVDVKKLLKGTKAATQSINDADETRINSLLVASEGNLDLLAGAIKKAEVLSHEWLSDCFPRIMDGLKKVKIDATKSVREDFIKAMHRIDPGQFDYESITGRPKPDDWTDEHSQCYLMMAKMKHPKHRLLHGSVINGYGAYNLQGVLNEYIK